MSRKKYLFLILSPLLLLMGTELILRMLVSPQRIPSSSLRLIACYKDFQCKNFRPTYFIKHAVSFLLPPPLWQSMLESELKRVDEFDQAYVRDRVNYYCKLNSCVELPINTTTIATFQQNSNWSFYYIDFWEHVKYFPFLYRIAFLPGDITYVPTYPTIVKSRPISENNGNAVIMKLDKLRHFFYVNDQKSFFAKKNLLIWRGGANNDARRDFVNKFHNHELCNVNNNYLSIYEQLDYKFILSLEGNDVATNLKWIMSSNSLCFAPKHKYETWFMEGKLIPNYHYVLIKDDYSDLIEKINYYIQHPDEALEIIQHANEYVEQFKNEKREKLISLLVLEKYFQYTHKP